jgi:hypothetical protein
MFMSQPPPSTRRSSWRLVSAVIAVLAVAASLLVAPTPASAAEPRANRISRAEIISRAQDWWQRQIPYDQTESATTWKE